MDGSADSKMSQRMLWIAEGLSRSVMTANATKAGKSAAPVLLENDFSSDLRRLYTRAPLNAQVWRECFQAGSDDYAKTPIGNLSLDQSVEARWFGQFVAAFAFGRVLDVGCGPQEKAAYLKAIPNDRLAGIDPIAPYHDHPFAYRKALAEFIPASDQSFETVIIGTTLDHFYLLDQALDEIDRVLVPGGRVIVWTSLNGDGKAYDPYNDLIEKIDRYHLYHVNHDQVMQLFDRYMLLEEYIEGQRLGFFAFEKSRE
jgi:SAM-dependent methyltransferase